MILVQMFQVDCQVLKMKTGAVMLKFGMMYLCNTIAMQTAF